MKLKPSAANSAGYVAIPVHEQSSDLERPQPHRSTPHLIVKMANRGYDVVVDVDTEVSPVSIRFLSRL